MKDWNRMGSLALLGGIALAGACTTQPTPAAVAPSPPVPIDGRYDGVIQLVRGDAINCGDQNPIMLQVANQAFTYRLSQPQADWQPVLVFATTIQPDGSFNTQSGTGYMRGTVASGHMQGTIAGDICEFSFAADRGGTW
jgi:hypothetical protein